MVLLLELAWFLVKKEHGSELLNVSVGCNNCDLYLGWWTILLH